MSEAKTGAGSPVPPSNVNVNEPASATTAQMDNENTKPIAATADAALPSKESLSNSESVAAKPVIAPPTQPKPTLSQAGHTTHDAESIGAENQQLDTAIVNEPGSVLVLTLLLPSSGARHPYKIDEKYLAKRNVPVPGTTESGRKDPFSISVYTLKELILREWREEWEAKPSSPSSIRLIHFGRLLDDKITLKGMSFAPVLYNVLFCPQY